MPCMSHSLLVFYLKSIQVRYVTHMDIVWDMETGDPDDRLTARQDDAEVTALAQFAVYFNCAAVCFDNLLGNRQP